VPFDLKAATHAAKLGQTFAEANRASKAGAALRDIVQAIRATLEGGAAPVAAAAADKKSLLGKIDFKSMLAKKDKAGAPAK
jgi:pilus assembly protein CpaE